MKTKLLFTCIFLLTTHLTFSQWTQVGSDIDGEAMGDESGRSVSLSADGNRLAIGAPYNDDNGVGSGHVRIYELQDENWVQLGSDIDGEAVNDLSGLGRKSVSLSADGNRVAIGALYNDGNGANSGHVRIYGFNGVNWVQLGQDIDGEAAEDRSGYSVRLSANGNRVVIAAINNDGNGDNSGHVRIYELQGENWVQLGQDIDGEAIDDSSGWSVSLSTDGNRVAITAINNDGNGVDSGHVRIYQWDAVIWNQIGSDIEGENTNDWSGWSVSLSADGNRVAIGAAHNDGNGVNSGHVRIYDYQGGSWNQLGQDIDGEAVGDSFGWSVSLNSDGSIVAVGAIYNDGNGVDSGHVRIYQWDGASWNQIAQNLDGENPNDHSGWSVSLNNDGNIVAIGSYRNDGNGNDSGHVRIYEFPTPNTSLGDGSGGNATGEGNLFMGYQSGYYTTTGNDNTFVGSQSGHSNTTGSSNTYIGERTGYTSNGSGNLFLGYNAGYNEAGSNRLYIDNSDTDTPLIWGDFQNDILNFNGDVEIGTEAVTADLNVKGKVIATKDIRNQRVKLSGTNGYIRLRHENAGGGFKAAIAPSDPAGLDELLLNFDSAFANGTRVMGNGLLVDGKMAIGNGSAEFDDDYQLSVVGNIIAEELRIRTYTITGWPDYVFEDNYKLPTLEELEAHITTQKHLPGIPSAEEVAKEGFAVAEMQAKLLEKIEELSLHLIEMNKRINALERENQILKNRK